jgi:hypothetical protein
MPVSQLAYLGLNLSFSALPGIGGARLLEGDRSLDAILGGGLVLLTVAMVAMSVFLASYRDWQENVVHGDVYQYAAKGFAWVLFLFALSTSRAFDALCIFGAFCSMTLVVILSRDLLGKD